MKIPNLTLTADHKILARKIALIAILFIVTGFLFPWWLMPAVAFAYGCMMGAREKSAVQIFAQMFAGVFIAWALTAFVFDVQSHFQLSTRLGGMFKCGFPLGGVLVVSVIGALLASFSAVAGAGLRIRVVDV